MLIKFRALLCLLIVFQFGSEEVSGFIGCSTRMPRYRSWNTRLHSFASLKYLSTPDRRIINGIDQFKSKRGIKAYDVATMVGVSIDEAESSLVKLSSLFVGHSEAGLTVSSNGEIAYRFPRDFKRALIKRDLLSRWHERWDTQIKPFVHRAVRILFGVGLVVNVMAVWGMVFAASSSSNHNSEKKEKGSRRETNHFSSHHYSSYSSPNRLHMYINMRDVLDVFRIINRIEPSHSQEMGMLESMFSYVFGDGNPNVGIEQKQLQRASEAIKKLGGVVVAEELAPYFNPPPLQKSSQFSSSTASVSKDVSLIVDESWILPVLVALKGLPMVTKDGDIVYKFEHVIPLSSPTSTETSFSSSSQQFPGFVNRLKSKAFEWINNNNSFLSSLLNNDAYSSNNPLPSPIVESVTPFSNAPVKSQLIAFGLSLLHLLGITILGIKMSPFNFFRPSNHMLSSTFLTLGMYSLTINLYPYFRNRLRIENNRQVLERNQNRKAWYEHVRKLSREVFHRTQEQIDSRDKLSFANPKSQDNHQLKNLGKNGLFRKLRAVAEIRQQRQHQHSQSPSCSPREVSRGGSRSQQKSDERRGNKSSKNIEHRNKQEEDERDVIYDSNMDAHQKNLQTHTSEEFDSFDRKLNQVSS